MTENTQWIQKSYTCKMSLRQYGTMKKYMNRQNPLKDVLIIEKIEYNPMLGEANITDKTRLCTEK